MSFSIVFGCLCEPCSEPSIISTPHAISRGVRGSILSTIGVTAKSKNRKDHPYERSRSIYHNPSSHCHHDFPSSHRLYAVFDAQKRQRPQRLQPCDEVTQFLISTLSNHSIEFLFRCFRDSILYNNTTC